jgi:hypothetical protein
MHPVALFYHNLPMCGRYRLSRRKQLVEECFDCGPVEATAFGVVVRIEQVLIQSPLPCHALSRQVY